MAGKKRRPAPLDAAGDLFLRLPIAPEAVAKMRRAHELVQIILDAHAELRELVGPQFAKLAPLFRRR